MTLRSGRWDMRTMTWHDHDHDFASDLVSHRVVPDELRRRVRSGDRSIVSTAAERFDWLAARCHTSTHPRPPGTGSELRPRPRRVDGPFGSRLPIDRMTFRTVAMAPWAERSIVRRCATRRYGRNPSLRVSRLRAYAEFGYDFPDLNAVAELCHGLPLVDRQQPFVELQDR